MKTKLLLQIILAFAPFFTYAEDIIVLRDGSVIRAMVSDIGTSEISYKKISNPNGPTYHINKSEIFSLNYENGEQDVFSNDFHCTPNQITIANNNQTLISHYNDMVLTSPNTKLGGKTAYAIGRYKVENESILSTDDIEISFTPRNGFHPTILNKSDKFIYIDLSSSYYSVNGGQLQPFFISDVVSTQSATTTSANIGLFFGFLSLNGGHYETNSDGRSATMEKYFPIPSNTSLPIPGRKYSSEGQIKTYYPLAEVFIKHDYLKKSLHLREWQTLDYTTSHDSPVFDATLIIAYSHDRNFENMKQVTIKLKLSELLGVPGLGGSSEIRNKIYNQDGLILTRVLGDFF